MLVLHLFLSFKHFEVMELCLKLSGAAYDDLWDDRKITGQRSPSMVLDGILACKMLFLVCTVQLKGATKAIKDWFSCDVAKDILELDCCLFKLSNP